MPLDKDKRSELMKNYSRVKGQKSPTENRRGSNNVVMTSYVIKPVDKMKKKSRSQYIPYDFLQNLRPVFRWATATHGIARNDLELLLYLYPLGMFQRKDVVDFVVTLGFYGESKFNKMSSDGWIEKYPVKAKSLFVLSSKAKILCKHLHLMLIGEKDIPLDKRRNSLVESGTNVDKHYMKMLMSINSKRKEGEID